MRTDTEDGAPATRRTGIRVRAGRIGVLTLVGFTLWSVSGTVPATAEGSARCSDLPHADTADYLTGAACPPQGFEDTMGYEPALVRTSAGWRYTKPRWAGGNCSGPLTDVGPFWDFTSACQAHDYGYDLVRFGMGDRAEADALLYRDMMVSCAKLDPAVGGGCRAVAHWAKAVLDVGQATGFDPEPVTRTW